jgi:hypothetical protein
MTTPPPCVACQQPVSRAKMKYAHRAWVSAKRVDSWKDELDVLRRYHMPRDLAIGILGRIYRKGQTNAYVRRHRIQRKAAA